MGGCYSAYASSRKLRGRISFVLPVSDLRLDCDEFVAVSLHLRKMASDEYLAKAFRYFDKDGSGFIELEELREELGPNEQVILDIIRDVDTDQDGRISYQEFELMMKAGADWRNASRHYSKANFDTLSRKLCKDRS